MGKFHRPPSELAKVHSINLVGVAGYGVLCVRAARQAQHKHRALARFAGHSHVAAHHARELP